MEKKKDDTDQFTQLPYQILRNKEAYKEMFECIPLYLYLQSCVYRGEHGADRYRLYEKCYKCGIIASSVAIEELAEVHGCSENTVRKWRDLLVKHGLINFIYKTIYIKNRIGKKITAKPYIYILGYTKTIMKDGEVKIVPVYDVSKIDVSKIVV